MEDAISNVNMNKTYLHYKDIIKILPVIWPYSSLDKRKAWIKAKYDVKLFQYPVLDELLENNVCIFVCIY